MYRVKNDGKGAAAFFDAGMEREALARMKVEQSLRLAILEKRFCCAFQPKVDIRTKDIKGIEALVRLRDDEGVIQAPGTFINLAVELGLIDELTHLVLAEIVRSIDLINETFGHDTTISINVAAKQAGNPAVHALVRAGARGDRLSRALHDRGDGRRLRRQNPFPGPKSCRSSANSGSGFRSTISASAIRRCRRWPTSPPTRSRSIVPSSPTFINARAARASCGRSNR